MTATRAKRRPPSGRTWLIRIGLALVLGLAVGAGAGVFAVNTLEPGRAGVADSLQLMLDSIAKAPAAPPPEATPSIDSAPAAPPAAVAVPSVIDLDEGAARDALVAAGLQVGEVRFAASAKAAGTVLATEPAAGTTLATGTPVVLILSDGRPPADTGAPAVSDLRRHPDP
ncbi:MAG: PASTA domain-containing protein [Gemmatimonadetes bacterium]|nr:PASTA domain-containing protein [Gemmatimonadota bacterium]